MEENVYIQQILKGMGLAINEKNCNEIIINYPLKYDEKNKEYLIDYNYKIVLQTLGTFLVDFLNCDFFEYKDFFNFFSKYSLSLLSYQKLFKIFKNYNCSETVFQKFILKLFNKHKIYLQKLQEQLDMIIDYCLFSDKDSIYKPIEKLYVLRRISPDLSILLEHQSIFYSVLLFSSYPGATENEIYDFLKKKENQVVEYDLLLPTSFESILYKSICTVLKERIYLKSCKNCNKYFITKHSSTEYCSNIAPGEIKKTCKQIGRKTIFEETVENDPILLAYYKLYNRKAMMKTRNSDISYYVEDFNRYKIIGKEKLKKYKSKKISPEEFLKWIEKNE